MKTIVLASNNKHKIKEFKYILKDYNILSLEDIGFNDEIEETGSTFEENALIKAKAVHDYLINNNKNYIVIADDSGLYINSLNGEPGIYSARYSGVHGDSKANRDKVLKKLDGKEGNDREAYFMCALILYYPDDTYKYFIGKTYGEITTEEIGDTDFGYDCIFYSHDLNKTFGEATEKEKNSVSHRKRAIEEMVKYLEK